MNLGNMTLTKKTAVTEDQISYNSSDVTWLECARPYRQNIAGWLCWTKGVGKI